MKTPEEFTPAHWTAYIVSALRRENGGEPNTFLYPFFHMKVQGALNQGFDPYMLAVGIDLLALHCEGMREESIYEGLNNASILQSLFKLPRSRVFWRAVWFSRFASSDHEIGYYRYWLREFGYAYDTNEHPRSAELLRECKKRLEEAEQMIQDSNADVTFKLHWLKENMSETHRIRN